MIRLVLILSMALASTFSHENALAQFLDADTGGGLRLSLEPIQSVGSLPIHFAIVLTNVSGHDLRLPRPALECGDVINGYLFLRAQYVPSDSNSHPLSRSCVIDHAYTPILDRAKKWNALAPGESLRVEIDLAKAVPDAPSPGTYTIWADFTPPTVGSEDLKLLQQQGIAVPTYRLATPAVEYHVPAN